MSCERNVLLWVIPSKAVKRPVLLAEVQHVVVGSALVLSMCSD